MNKYEDINNSNYYKKKKNHTLIYLIHFRVILIINFD